MSEIKIGQFIAQLRKERKLTQKELAAQLHITDKAVSKWETGLSCPDIALLTSLADILGVTTGELLNGQRSPSAPSEEVEKTINIRLAKILSISPFDGWDLLSFAIIAVIAVALFVIDHFTTSHLPGR